MEIYLLKGFAKNLWCQTKKLKNNNKLELQLYFKDTLNTGISLVKCADDFKKNCTRSYISISLLGLTVYIAKIYHDFI